MYLGQKRFYQDDQISSVHSEENKMKTNMHGDDILEKLGNVKMH